MKFSDIISIILFVSGMIILSVTVTETPVGSMPLNQVPFGQVLAFAFVLTAAICLSAGNR